jgi:hypothetical protein
MTVVGPKLAQIQEMATILEFAQILLLEHKMVKEVLKIAHTMPATLVIVMSTTMQTSMLEQCAVNVEVVLQRVELLTECRIVHLQLIIHGCSGQQELILIRPKSELIQANKKQQHALIQTLEK